MKKVITSILVLLLTASLFCEEKIDTFWKMMNDSNVTESEIENFLTEWEQKKKKDPEVYVAWFNYYYSKSSEEVIAIGTERPATGQYMQGQNENGETIYFYPVYSYDEEAINKAFEKIDIGISYNPKRLDLYFGKAHVCYITGKYELQLNLLYNVFELNQKYKGKWLWSGNVPMNKLNIGFEESIHEYVTQLVDAVDSEKPGAAEAAKALAIRFATEFPKNSIACNDAGITQAMFGDIAVAKVYLEKGHENDPTDMLILTNLAYICEDLGLYDEAKVYFLLMLESDDEYYSNRAKNRLSSEVYQ